MFDQSLTAQHLGRMFRKLVQHLIQHVAQVFECVQRLCCSRKRHLSEMSEEKSEHSVCSQRQNEKKAEKHTRTVHNPIVI